MREILLVQPVFMKSILCAIYGPICKLAKKIWEKKTLNVTTVKLLLKNKIQCFWVFLMSFCFKLYLKVNIHPFHHFFSYYCLKMASKIGNISKFTKDQTNDIYKLDCRWHTVYISWKLFVVPKFLKPQNFNTTFQKNLIFIFLSLLI